MLPPLMTFFGLSLVVICTPGPDTALTVRNSLAGGRRGGVSTAAGVASGQLVWTLASAVGLSALLQMSQVVFSWLRILGAAYLIFLGVRSLLSAWQQHGDVGARADVVRLRGTAAFRQGLISNLANPKMLAFFVSLLPQFVPGNVDPFVGFMLLGTGFCLLTFVWLTLYATALHWARVLLLRSSVRRVLDMVAGAVLIGFGTSLATEGIRGIGSASAAGQGVTSR